MKIINLLPKSRQQSLRDEALLRSLLKVIWISAAGFAVVVLSQLGVKLYLEDQRITIQNSINQLNFQVNQDQNAALKNQITQINNTIADYKNLSSASPKWSKVLRAFSVLPPAGVVINSLSINFAAKSVTITGVSPTRDLVIQLYNNIVKDSTEFYNVDYPLENVVQPTNNSFHFTFNIRDSLIQQ